MAEKKVKTGIDPEVNDSYSINYYREYSPVDIVIKPYFKPDIPNMGLERYGQVLFDGAEIVQSLRSKESNGVARYITGLDEFADSVKRIHDSKERLAKIKSIRNTVSILEFEIFANKVDPEDPDFWKKVSLSPINEEYWKNVNLRIDNEGKILDPNDPKDLLIIYAIENEGFDDIAPSYEAAEKSSKPPKFYLEKRRDVRIEDGKLKELRDRAIFELFKIRMEAPQDLFILAKNILPIAMGNYKIKDKVEIIYGDLSDYIEGVSVEKNKKQAPVRFLQWLQKDKEYLTIRAYVLEAIFLKHIITKADNKMYIYSTGSMLGGNIEEAIEHLKQPMNQRDLDTIQSEIDPIWNR